MFPTAGYFKGVECPFYKEGTCQRPYCHYKHAKIRVQPSLRQPTRLAHTSTISRRNQVNLAKLEVKLNHPSQESSSTVTKDQQDVIQRSLPTCPAESQTADSKCDQVSTEGDHQVIVEEQSKQETSISCLQIKEGGDYDLNVSNTQPINAISDAKELYNSEADDLDKDHGGDCVSDTANSMPTTEFQNSSTEVRQAWSDNISTSTVTSESQEKLSSMMAVPDTETVDNTTLSPVIPPLQSGGSSSNISGSSKYSNSSSVSNEAALHDEASYEEADESVMFEELFGSSGEEDQDVVVEGAFIDDSDDELISYRKMDQRMVEEEFKRITTQSAADLPHTSTPKSSYENLGIKNKRQAHGNAELMKHGGVTVGRPKVKTTSNMNPLLNDPSGIYAGRKRKAHEQAGGSPDVSAAPVPKRPRLLVSVNAKIPTALRQNYLDSFIDEYLKFCATEEAYKKGLDDEQVLFKKANNKMLYMNLSSIALKRLRERASREQPSCNATRPDTKKASLPVGKKHSINPSSLTTSNRAPVQEKKVKKVERSTGTYYLDEIFKTTVNMEMHQKTKPHSHTNDDTIRVSISENTDNSTMPSKDHEVEPPAHKTTSKAKRPLSFDSALQKMDRKLKKKQRSRAGSPIIKKQFGINSPSPARGTEALLEEPLSVTSSPAKVNAKPASAHVQKLIDKGFAKVKTKSTVEQLSHPTNRISLTSSKLPKSTANVSKVAGHHDELSNKSKGKSVRQIVVSKSPSLSSPVSESVYTAATATSPVISAAKFYSSKVSNTDKIKLNMKANPTSTPIPASKAEKHPTSSPNYSILKKKEVVLTDEIFVQYMHSYLLTETQLVENGYPRPTNESGVASIMRKPDEVNDIKAVGPNAQRHTCCRCGKPFIIYNSGSYQSTEECCYHFKRLQKKKEYGEGVISYYPCCQGNRGSSGCQIAKMHVTRGAKLPLESGYVQTGTHPNISRYIPKVYALDCEMCYTTAGLELTRVSVIGTNNESVYESLVKPDYPVVDYNTKFSGITAQDLSSVTTRLQDVQSNLLNLFYEDTILLGHSLESDLQSLKIIHSRVVDTALVFPHRMGLPYKRALRTITAEFLHKIIQDEVDGGHDSKEDAIACMNLMKWKIKSDLQKTTRRGSVT